MTIERLLYEIGSVGIRNRVINYAAAGSSIYELNGLSVKDYPILFASPTGQHEVRTNTTDYSITLYYLDRLLNDSGNDVQVFSTAVEQLKLILRMIGDVEGVVDVSETYSIQNFIDTEAMNDRVAGAYATVTVTVMNIGSCDDDTMMLPITVGNLQSKSVYINENGEYLVTYDDDDYDGLSQVEIVVDVEGDGGYDEGYNAGYETGDSEGYDRGYSDGYDSGKVDGVNKFKNSLSRLTAWKNGEYSGYYNGVRVDVLPSINVGELGIKLQRSTFEEIPYELDFSSVKDFSDMFKHCYDLRAVAFDSGNLISVESFNGAFEGLAIETVDMFADRSTNLTDMSYMFNYCSDLRIVGMKLPSSVTKMNGLFHFCHNLEKVYPFNCSSLSSRINAELFDGGLMEKLTDLQGFIDLKYALGRTGLSGCPNLSRESCISIMNYLYDFTGNGETPASGQGTLLVHPNFLTAVGDDISIATGKGWNVVSA